MSSQGTVIEWKMTEQQRLDYIAKYPIVPTKQAGKKKDFRWRSEKGSSARWGTKK